MALYTTGSNYISDTITTANITVNTTFNTNTVTSITLTGDLQFNGNGGTTGDPIVKTSATTQGWTKLPPSTIIASNGGNQFLTTDDNGLILTYRFNTIRSLVAKLDNILTVNFNASTSNLISFGISNLNAFKFAKLGYNIYLGLSWVEVAEPLQTIRVNTSGTYKISYNIVLDNASVGSSQVAMRIIQSGPVNSTRVYSTVLPALTAGNNVIQGFVIIYGATGNTFQFFSQRTNGTGALNCVAADSTINISLIDTTI
jgi:hypothetical protein